MHLKSKIKLTFEDAFLYTYDLIFIKKEIKVQKSIKNGG